MEQDILRYKLVETIKKGQKIAELYVNWAKTDLAVWQVAILFLTKLNKKITRTKKTYRQIIPALAKEEEVLIDTVDIDTLEPFHYYIQKTDSSLVLYKSEEGYEVIDLSTLTALFKQE